MKKTLSIITFVLLSSLSLACQTYTKGLQDSVIAADETAAMSALRTVTVAEQTYSTSNEGSYGTFDQLVKAGFLDSRFNSDKPKFKGYVLTLRISGKGATDPSYSIAADPEPPQSGRHFYADSTSGVIHVNPSQPAAASDPAMSQ